MNIKLLFLGVFLFFSFGNCTNNTKNKNNDVVVAEANNEEEKKNTIKGLNSLVKLSPKDYWGKQLLKKGKSLDGLYYKSTKQNGAITDLFFYDLFLQKMGTSADGYPGPTAQYKEFSLKLPRKLGKGDYWGKILSEKGVNLSSLYFLPKPKKELDIYFFGSKLQTMGTSETGFPGPTKQFKTLSSKIPRKLTKAEYWGAALLKDGLKLDNIFYLKGLKNTVDLYYKGYKIQTFGPSKQGFKGPKEQIANFKNSLNTLKYPK